MADLTITAANVVAGSGADIDRNGTAGEALTQGQAVYKSSSDQKYYKAQADDADTDEAVGIALNAASANQPVSVLRSGLITIGATPVVATEYVLSADNAGGIAPHSDLANPDLYTRLGYGYSATELFIDIKTTGLTVPV